MRIVNAYFVLISIYSAISLLTYIRKDMREGGFKKEEKFAKNYGILSIIGSILLYLIIKIIY